MIGLIIGLIGGIALFFFLSRLTLSITKNGKMNIWFMLLFIFMPMVLLLSVAFIASDDLLITAIAMTIVLVVCTIVNIVVEKMKSKGNDKK